METVETLDRIVTVRVRMERLRDEIGELIA